MSNSPFANPDNKPILVRFCDGDDRGLFSKRLLFVCLLRNSQISDVQAIAQRVIDDRSDSKEERLVRVGNFIFTGLDADMYLKTSDLQDICNSEDVPVFDCYFDLSWEVKKCTVEIFNSTRDGIFSGTAQEFVDIRL